MGRQGPDYQVHNPCSIDVSAGPVSGLSDEALLRLCRLCVSIKMHTQGMSVADAAKFFHDNCYYEQKPSMAEAMRGTFDPGYLNYTLGKLMIRKLRDDWTATRGGKSAWKQFHDEFLSFAGPPIPIVRKAMLGTSSGAL